MFSLTKVVSGKIGLKMFTKKNKIKKINLLIVDDSKFIRELVGDFLSEDKQINVVGYCGDGDEVFEFLLNNDVDVILMDYSMKRINGDLATEIVKLSFPHVNVIMFSSHHDEFYRNRSIEVGVSGYVYKSTDLNWIKMVIKYVNDPSMIIDFPITGMNQHQFE